MQIPPKANQAQTNATKAAKHQKPIQKPAVAQSAAQASKITKQKLAQQPAGTSNLKGIKNNAAAIAPRSYAMVISSYENVSRNSEVTGDSADQLGKTIANRIKELNSHARRDIQELPEYKKLNIDDIDELGEEIADMLTEEDNSMKAFAFLKNPTFAGLMDSSENVHRSFAEMMQDNGEEKLLFGALQMVSTVNKSSTPPENPGFVDTRA
ncbi:MAG: hypothetical protein HQM14_15125 [SAR324 cluster bacterium]|nr:hypothetical protein [SAR324 cluster bacterium]